MRKSAALSLRTIGLVWGASRRYTLLALGTSITSALMLPAQMWISKVVLDRLFELLLVEGAQTAPDWMGIFGPVGAFFLVWLLGVISQSSAQNYKELLTLQVEARVNLLLLEKAAGLSIAFYENPAFFDQLNNARREVYRVPSAVAQLLTAFQFGASLVAALGLLSRVALWVPLVLLGATLPQVVLQSHYMNRRYRLYISRTTAERKIWYYGWLLSAREAVKEVRLFQLQRHFLGLFRQATGEYFEGIRKIVLSEERSNVLLGLLATLGTLGVWVYAILQALARRITVGDLALTFQAAELSRNTLSEMFRWGGLIFENTLYLRNLFEFLDLAPDAVEGALVQRALVQGALDQRALDQREAAEGSADIPAPAEAVVEFREVSFRYPGAERLALEKLSFVLRPGERVALVGENGSGKTTVVKLLARLYDPSGGQILFGGRDLREFEPEAYYRLFGIIFQDFVRYSLTAQENIGLGQMDEMGDRPRVREAARQGGALELIERLPKGFETVLGRDFEEGVDLSGGEWQKIALSRAFMRQAGILILDEPTSSLDARAEADIYQRFAELTAGKLTIFISHRLSSCKMADHILFLKEGRLVEEGTHAELMAGGGEYYQMFTLQAERYR